MDVHMSLDAAAVHNSEAQYHSYKGCVRRARNCIKFSGLMVPAAANSGAPLELPFKIHNP